MDAEYEFTAEVWRYDGAAAWYFVTVPFDEADEIDERAMGRQRGFGSVRVEVTIGATTWATSIFPDTKRQSYVLPVKKAVRDAEGLAEDVRVQVKMRLLDV